jgi:hypothetical protein
MFSDVICMAVMLPSTICAGMVLPLIVHFFYRCGYGEEYIGKVYAVNTFGGIVGVIAATWLLMPLTGAFSCNHRRSYRRQHRAGAVDLF